MKNVKNICFDLDGTLIDSHPGVSGSLRKTFAALDIVYDGDFAEFLGPPYKTAFPEMLGISGELTDKAIDMIRGLYEEEGIYDYALYPGTAETLEALFLAGKAVYLITSKLERHAKLILEHAGILRFFNGIFGQSDDGSRAHKTDVMEHALREGKLDPHESVMVGDRYFDIDAAHGFGIKSVAVLFGYGGLDELTACSPTAMVRDMDELRALLLP